MNRTACYLVLSLLVYPIACAAQTQETPRPLVFGINAGTSNRDLQAAKAAGCTNVRVGCGWDLVEKEPGQYDFSDPDRDVDQVLKYGMEPIFLVVATPKWALAPEKRDRPWAWPAEPEFYPQARQFYEKLAARYRGKVKYFEFWNEENGYGWNATNKPDEYAPILKVAYEAMKKGNPDCLVSVGGLDGAGWKGYPRYLERLYELGCRDFFDAVTVHPYRWDGPIDTFGLQRIRDIMVRHGDADKKIWITEYGWSKQYGHHNKARWLKESLDILTSPEFDYVIQASIHTLGDFDDEQFGMCDRQLNPRAAYQVFRDYPKDWNIIVEQRKKNRVPESAASIPDGGFEQQPLSWTPYGAGLSIKTFKELGIEPEEGNNTLAFSKKGQPEDGGVYCTVKTPRDLPIRVSARVFTNVSGGSPDQCRVRAGIDPTGGTIASATTVIWGRTIDTAGAWDTIGVGHGDPILPQANVVTVFLEYKQKGGEAHRIAAFDTVEFSARPDTFVLPEPKPIPFDSTMDSRRRNRDGGKSE